ncbi:hypothetical protein ABPG75_004419 [Micractinium tetrahymenae]
MALVPSVLALPIAAECLHTAATGLLQKGIPALLSRQTVHTGAAARLHSSAPPAANAAASGTARSSSSNQPSASDLSALEAALERAEIAYVMLKGGAVHSVMWDSSVCRNPRRNPLLPSTARLAH